MASPAHGKLVWSGKLWMLCLLVLFFFSFIRCEGEIRLADEYIRDEGRVEIFHDSQWGTVCDDDWDDIDARVVCRQLLYSGNVGVARSGGSFGLGSGPIHLDNVDCGGYESRLTDCSHAGWGNNNCKHSQDAGVYCGDIIEGEIRLVIDGVIGGEEGRVEIFHEGQWGTICDAGWDDHDARVVRRQLGYSSNVGVARSGGSFGQGSGPIHLNFVGCRGYKSRLTLCNNYGWGIHNCDHSEDAGVYCGDIIEGTIRLVMDGVTGGEEGRVEIFLQGQWGTVCSDSWDDRDARVVCRQRGFSGNVGEARSGGFYGPGSGPINLDDVGCTGVEARLTDCSNAGWGNANCGHGLDAGVYCGEPPNQDQPTIKTSSRAASVMESVEPPIQPTMKTSSRAASLMESVGVCFSLLTMLPIIAIDLQR